jgi:hypothetical protein
MEYWSIVFKGKDLLSAFQIFLNLDIFPIAILHHLLDVEKLLFFLDLLKFATVNGLLVILFKRQVLQFNKLKN